MPAGPVLVISGTNRPGANALHVANTLVSLYRSHDFPVELLSLAELPPEVFTGAAYATKPPGMIQIQQRVLAASGLHIVTPEYNGSFPGVLKYFIDMLKFPESFERKPCAFVGEALGIWGGIRSVEQLQLIFGYRNAHIYPVRVFIPGVNKAIDPQGNWLDTGIKDRLAQQVEGFIRFLVQFVG